MPLRYRTAVALTLALAAFAAAAAKPAHHAKTRVSAAVRSASDLYSARALRRAKIIFQLEMLELRSEHLERVRRAIEQRLPVDQILKV